MAGSSTTAYNAKISSAALKICSSRGWEHVTLEAVAKEAKISLSVLKQNVLKSVDLISIIAEQIDGEAFKVVGKISGTPHEMLFDIFMARFDVLQKNRKAIVSMTKAARQDRRLTCALSRATLDSMYRVIDKTRLNAPARPILAAGLMAIYGWSFFAWYRDASSDLAKTMAALDRGLRLAEKASDLCVSRS